MRIAQHTLDVAVRHRAACLDKDLAPGRDEPSVTAMKAACAVAGESVVAVGVDAVPAVASVAHWSVS